jgi:DNA-binding response OmpR family regulator
MNSDRSSKGDILIVDDTADKRRKLSAVLTEQDYDVRSVTNGSTALMGVQAQSPDLILLDIHMPGMNGYEVCQRLKANPNTQDIPVIFISALNEVFDKVKAFTVGGVDYITKPFQVEEVVARVEHQVTIRSLQAQLLRALEQERALNQRIEEMATVEERNRIARDIHDSLGHALVALNIQIETALTLWRDNPDTAYEFLLEAKQLGSNALQAVRESVSDMRAEPLQGQLLEKAIATLTQEFHFKAKFLPDGSASVKSNLGCAVNRGIFFPEVCSHVI